MKMTPGADAVRARVRAVSKAGGLEQTISAVTLPMLIDTTPSEALDQNQHALLRGWTACRSAPSG
jgi:hypothetical protein